MQTIGSIQKKERAMSTNEFKINETRYVWDLNNGLPVIRPFLILKIEFNRGTIFYTGSFQYENTGDPEVDYGFSDKEYSENDVFSSVEECRTVAKEIGDYHFMENEE